MRSLGFWLICVLRGKLELYNRFCDTLAKAEKGDADAQFNLGVMYNNECGLKNYAKAINWYKKAEEQGEIRAKILSGLNSELSDILAKAETGHANAQFHLGVRYETGLGVPQDYAKAIEWFEKSAEQGYADAQFALGMLYRNGFGLAKNEVKAVEWYSKAAKSGNVMALEALKNDAKTLATRADGKCSMTIVFNKMKSNMKSYSF